ncbi:F-box domain-containing protein [Mycena venus]|uniref:F-box domain-containing protein n=1 Tax=Mycena venus TaxID=2733690 RepID=A0A8H7CF61_9AGAR|nr:F-box domain-containing protein [Mycena venus]
MLDALAADRARVADLDAQIQDLERSLAALRLEKLVVQERLDTYKYPVLTLPNEIVSEIFIHFLPTYPSCPPLGGPLSPTHLARICRRWREIALVTPALWRAVSLSKISYSLPSDVKQIWLARSGSHPISIHMNEYARGNVPGGSRALAAVLLHCARWEYVKLRLFNSSLPTIEGGLPLLRHLDLELDYYPKDLVIRDAPLLRSVVLDVNTLSNIVLPWTQLTRLTLRVITIDDCIPVLQKVTNLVHCKLQLQDRDEGDPLPDIVLPYLSTLSCKQWGHGEYSLDIFIVPALRSLTVTEQFLQPSPIDSLKSFIAKSGCMLQNFSFDHIRSYFNVDSEDEQKIDGDPDPSGNESNSNSDSGSPRPALLDDKYTLVGVLVFLKKGAYLVLLPLSVLRTR